MADEPEKSASTSDAESIAAALLGLRTDASGAAGEPEKPKTFTNSRPRPVGGDYPPRRVTYYQISSSDIRSVGVAQAGATIFAALGTFALSNYMDFSKDITLALDAGTKVPQFLNSVTTFCKWGWIICWIIAVLAFIWQGIELNRIKEEHGELTLRLRALNFIFRRQRPSSG